MAAPLPVNERDRLIALQSYEIIDTAAETEYDAITNLASKICGTSVSLITMLDEKRQWFKSAFGTDVKETLREYAFCSYAIGEPEKPFVIPDMRKDHRFSENPLVTEDPHVVFYAGVPLKDNEGFAIGTLCVLDMEEKTLTDFQMHALQVLAGQVVKLLELRRKLRTHERFQRLMEQRNSELQKAANLLPLVEEMIAQLNSQIDKTPVGETKDASIALVASIAGLLKDARRLAD